MAIDNLNYYSAWLPAGQQTDRYSSQPWCLRSKNLDIFSSSKSVKATAWSEPVAWASDIIKQDGDLILKTDWKVYDISSWSEVLVVDPSVNFPVYQVSYNWRFGDYEDATWGTVQDLITKYEWDELKSFVVFTDRASYTRSAVKFTPNKEFWSYSSNLTFHDTQFTQWYKFEKNSTSGATSNIDIKIENPHFSTVPIKVYASQSADSDTDISLRSITVEKERYYYDPELDQMVYAPVGDMNLPLPETDIKDGQVTINVPCMPWQWDESQAYFVRLSFAYTRHEWITTYWWSGSLYVDFNNWKASGIMAWEDWDYNEFYSYLPISERKLTPVGEYYWMRGTVFQILDTWSASWVTVANDTREKKIRYELTEYMWWNNDVSMDVIWMIAWNESIYMIGNMNWNWYIFPCDLTWQRGTPFIAYWCTFKGAVNIDYLLYLVWDDRWVNQLWVYNWQELVPLLWGNLELENSDFIDAMEQYPFDWKMVEYRGNLVLSTEDNRIFEYWQTYWGKAWVFIHELPWTIKELRANGNDLSVKYTENNTDYTVVYQDSKYIKTYNTEWMAEYPIILWNHLLEKEETDLYVSYILPARYCTLEFWGMANHYHFWTFTSNDSASLSTELSYKIKWVSGNYSLKFIERNFDQYTFRLEWDLPILDDMELWMRIETPWWIEVLHFTKFNHFRKIWEITTSGYQEWEFRFHNLNNKLELPKSHSLQIMVKGYGTSTHTPELFALDLVANQRERW